MKWLPFLILAAAATILQTTVARTIAIHAVSPDLMFLLAVHYALLGPWPEAAIAAWVLGLLFDTQTSSPWPLGLYAFCYGGAAWAMIRVRQVVFRDHPAAQIVITLVFTFLVQLAAWVFVWWRSQKGVAWSEIGWQALFTAVYTAALAPYVHWGLGRLNRWTGLRPGQRGSAYR